MTKTEREESLINARRLCLALAPYALGQAITIILGPDHREQVADLIEQFSRLDNKERRQIAAGKLGAKHGKKGGRPVKRPVKKSKKKKAATPHP